MLRNDPMTRGADLYAQYCTKCHVLNGKGEQRRMLHHVEAEYVMARQAIAGHRGTLRTTIGQTPGPSSSPRDGQARRFPILDG
jgi:mono/diheme cytochrome c family protein